MRRGMRGRVWRAQVGAEKNKVKIEKLREIRKERKAERVALKAKSRTDAEFDAAHEAGDA